MKISHARNGISIGLALMISFCLDFYIPAFPEDHSGPVTVASLEGVGILLLGGMVLGAVMKKRMFRKT